MDVRPTSFESIQEEGWQVITSDWWHTPFESVSWIYSQGKPPDSIAKPPHYHERLFQACGAMFVHSAAISPTQLSLGCPGQDITLNPDLCGVRCAMEAVAQYEADVGFFVDSDPQSCDQRSRVDLSVEVREEDVILSRKHWTRKAEELMDWLNPEKSEMLDALANSNESRGSSPVLGRGGLHRSTSTLSSIDLTDSDLSFNSISAPSTPKRKSTEGIVEVKDTKSGAEGITPFSGRPLNVLASSFIPSALKATSPPHSLLSPKSESDVFTYPSLGVPPQPTVKMKKDEPGFYNRDGVESSGPGSAFLPPFLQSSSPRRRKAPASKTRAIIDRFRSSHHQAGRESGVIYSHSPSPNPPIYDFNDRLSLSEDDKPRSHSGMSSPSSLDEDEDGWVKLIEMNAPSQQSKAQRTRALFLALTRRRSGSTSPDSNIEGGYGEDVEIPTTSSPPSLSSALPSPDDGWIEGPPTYVLPKPEVTVNRRAQPHSRHRKRCPSPTPPLLPSNIPLMPSGSLTGLCRPTSSIPVSHFPVQSPASYIYASYPAMVPPMVYTSYVQQLQQVQLMQMQMQMHNGGRKVMAIPNSGEWFHPIPNTHPLSPLTARRESHW